MVHRSLNRVTQRQRLPLSSDHNHNLPAIQHRRDADRQRHMRHLLDVAVEEARVGEDGVVREGLDARTACERRARLIERDVSVFANTAKEKLDATIGFNLRFVGFTFADEVFGVAIEDIDLGGRNVDWGEGRIRWKGRERMRYAP